MHAISTAGAPIDFSHAATRSWLDTARVSWRTVACWHERARQRRALAALSDELLRDIGVTRFDAEHEANKPFWR
jgi:uncharacterized protein YjiS (DUF1127 family)